MQMCNCSHALSGRGGEVKLRLWSHIRTTMVICKDAPTERDSVSSLGPLRLSLIHISEPTRPRLI
eukprot:2517655-Amphidinium_carterae.1